MTKKQKPCYISPTLESITIRAKYEIPETDFSVVFDKIRKGLGAGWHIKDKIGDSFDLIEWDKISKEFKEKNEWIEYLKSIRSGIPVYLSVTAIEHHKESILVEVECHPSMWHIIAYTYGKETNFTENEVQEALSQCRLFVKQVMSIFKGKVVEPVSVYPIIQRIEIKSRLLNLGLQEIVDKLDIAERHIIQNNFPESLKSSRTAFEKMIDWQMNKRGLAQTNSYHNNLERIKSKGYLDPETTKLLQTYYECLSIIVHEKGVKPGIFEAQMGYGITLIMLDYFANKLP